LRTLRQVRQEGPNAIWIQGQVMEMMTNALAQDERCCHFDRLPKDWTDLQLQIKGEQAFTDAIGPDAKPHTIAPKFKVLFLNVKLTCSADSRKMDGIK
jgi:hypothetical protein